MKLCAVAVASIPLSPVVAADYPGKVTAVADGDTFTMESETGKAHVRICGIDAPERGQPGYGQAAGVLSNMIGGKTVHDIWSLRPALAHTVSVENGSIEYQTASAYQGGGSILANPSQLCCEPIPLSGRTKGESLNSLSYRELPKNSESKNQRIVSRFSPKTRIPESI